MTWLCKNLMPELVMWRTGELSSERRYLADLWGFVLTRQAHGGPSRGHKSGQVCQHACTSDNSSESYPKMCFLNVMGNLVLFSCFCSLVRAQMVQLCSFPECKWAASSLAGAHRLCAAGMLSSSPGHWRGKRGPSPWGRQACLSSPLWQCLEDTRAAWGEWVSSS